MQHAATLADAVARGRGIELRDLRFEMLVDHEQRLQRAADIAVAPRHDLVDRGFTRPETHSKTPSHCLSRSLLNRPIQNSRRGCERGRVACAFHARPAGRQGTDRDYKMTDDSRVTAHEFVTGKLHGFAAKPR